MKTLIAILLSTSLYASFQKGIARTTKNPVIQKRTFMKIIDMMEEEFQYLAKDRGDKLIVYGDWNDPTADMALARRWDHSAQVLIYRGMAHRREINPDALILIVCHEIGHLFGGTPYKHEYSQTSLEGQADYFATNKCIRKALKAWKNEDLDNRIKKAMLNVGAFLAKNWRVELPQFDTPDPNVVQTTNLKHPAPQCRLDTFVAGLNNSQRPSCWYRE